MVVERHRRRHALVVAAVLGYVALVLYAAIAGSRPVGLAADLLFAVAVAGWGVALVRRDADGVLPRVGGASLTLAALVHGYRAVTTTAVVAEWVEGAFLLVGLALVAYGRAVRPPAG